MKRIRANQDIKPVSEFRKKISACLEQIQDSKRPLVLTQRGHSAAVVLDVEEYDRLLDELETLRDIQSASEQLARGEGIDYDEAREQLLSELEQ
jgi:prevent-host-death family protein